MANAAEFAAMYAELRSGRLRPVIDGIFPAERAVEAFGRLTAPELFGKVVVELP